MQFVVVILRPKNEVLAPVIWISCALTRALPPSLRKLPSRQMQSMPSSRPIWLTVLSGRSVSHRRRAGYDTQLLRVELRRSVIVSSVSPSLETSRTGIITQILERQNGQHH